MLFNFWHHCAFQKFQITICIYRGADKSLARPGRKQTRKHIRDAYDFTNIEVGGVIKFFFPLQGKAPKEIHTILTETLACFLPGWAKDLSAPLYSVCNEKRPNYTSPNACANSLLDLSFSCLSELFFYKSNNTVLSIYFSYDIECYLVCPWIFFVNLGSALWIIRNYLQNSTCLSNSLFKARTKRDLCDLMYTHLRYSTLLRYQLTKGIKNFNLWSQVRKRG